MNDKLFTQNYFFACSANLLLHLGFYLIMPILALFLLDTFAIKETSVGVILSSYTIAAVLIRPFSGFFLDSFSRKKVYLIALFFFTLCFEAYTIASSILIFFIFRFLHGIAYGSVSVAGNTIIIDIVPSSRRGEGIGYYGIANNLAMIIGPMIGLQLHTWGTYRLVFMTAFLVSVAAFIFGCFIKTPYKQPEIRRPISLDRFFLKSTLPIGLNLILISAPYGIITIYTTLYAQSTLQSNEISGTFFTLMAIGLILSRFFSGKKVDNGRITEVIVIGMSILAFSYCGLWLTNYMANINLLYGKIMFLCIALFIGYGHGTIAPAMNNVFINMGSNAERGTANSSYLTCWDIGVGIGFIIGGAIAEHIELCYAYCICFIFTLCSALIFHNFTSKYYLKTKKQ